MVVSAAPTSTTNMTGFFTIVRGSSLRKESTMARDKIAVSTRDFFRIWAIGSIGLSKNLSSVHEQMLENRPETQRREEGERPNDEDCGDEQTAEECSGHGESTYGCRDGFLSGQVPCNRHNRDDHEEAPE